MKKTLLALTGLMLITACNAGSERSVMSTSGDQAVTPLTDEAICDSAALVDKIQNTPSLVAQPLFYFVASLQREFSGCSQEDVVTALANRLVSGQFVTVCQSATNCEPDVLAIVQAQIESIIGVSENTANILSDTSSGIVLYANSYCQALSSCGTTRSNNNNTSFSTNNNNSAVQRTQ